MTSTIWNPMSAKAAPGPRHRAQAGRDAAWRMGLAGLVLALAACGGGGGGGVTPPPQDPPVVTVPPAVTAIGEPIGAVASARVGPAGGSLASPDGQVELMVPAGALASEIELTATPISVTAPGGLRAYRLGPEGTTFAVPATVRFKLSDADLAGSAPEFMGIAYQDAQRQWRVSTQSTYASGQISVQTTHLSDWSQLSRLRLSPASAVVAVSKSLRISVQSCEWVSHTPPDSDLASIGAAQCKIDGSLGDQIRNWAVNGVKGGSASFGTIDQGNPQAFYTAPVRAPSPALVAVSVQVRPQAGSSTLLRLVSNITISETSLPTSFTGRFHIHHKEGGGNNPQWALREHSVSGQASFEPDFEIAPNRYKLKKGSFVVDAFAFDSGNCICAASGASGTLSNGAINISTSDKLAHWSVVGRVEFPVSCTKKPEYPEETCPKTYPLLMDAGSRFNLSQPPCEYRSVNGYTDVNKLVGTFTLVCTPGGGVELAEEIDWVFDGQ